MNEWNKIGKTVKTDASSAIQLVQQFRRLSRGMGWMCDSVVLNGPHSEPYIHTHIDAVWKRNTERMLQRHNKTKTRAAQQKNVYFLLKRREKNHNSWIFLFDCCCSDGGGDGDDCAGIIVRVGKFSLKSFHQRILSLSPSHTHTHKMIFFIIVFDFIWIQKYLWLFLYAFICSFFSSPSFMHTSPISSIFRWFSLHCIQFKS